MAFVKKHFGKIVGATTITALYFFTRLYHIMNLPIFTDEAIYTRWSQIAKNDASWRFISLTDGKQPMFVWFDMVAMKVVADPLLAGRLVSVLSGFASVVGLFFLGRELFKSMKVGLIASFIYVVYPFALVYDRMALYESLLTAFAVWALYFLVLLVRRIQLDIALLLGMVMGGGVLTKSSSFFAIYLLPLILLLFDWRHKMYRVRLLRWIALAVFSSVLAYGFYSILRLSPFFHIIEEKNALFVYPFSEWMTHPLRFFRGNLRGLFDWLIHYMTIPTFLLAMFPLFMCEIGYRKEKVFLFFWFSIPFFMLALFGKVLYPRFIFFMTIPLLLLAAHACGVFFEKLRSPFMKSGLFLLFFFMMARADYYIVVDIAHAPIPYADLEQYINGWPAGGGIKEAVSFFEKEAQKNPIFVGTQGTFGLMPYSFEIYLVDNPNVTIEGFWPITEHPPLKLIEASRDMPTYVVFYQPCPICAQPGEAPATWRLKKIATYQKGAGSSYLSIYQVIP